MGKFYKKALRKILMPAELPKVVKVRNLIYALKKLGFQEVGGTKHYKLVDSKGRIATITRSHDEIPRIMLNIILRKEIGMSDEELAQFREHL